LVDGRNRQYYSMHYHATDIQEKRMFSGLTI
jgi:hypothetical protein